MLLSRILAMKGVAATVSGNIAAFSPMVVPTSILVIGDMATIRIMIGNDLILLTKKSITLYRFGVGLRPCGPYSISSTATPKPKMSDKIIEAESMRRVAHIDGAIIPSKYLHQ
jgi:hypothetical protein